MIQANREHVVGVVCIVIAGVVLAITPSFPAGQETVGITGPAFFPNVLAVVFLITGTWKIVNGFVRRGSFKSIRIGEWLESLRRPEMITVLLLTGMLVLFTLLFEVLGYAICTAGFLFVLMSRLGVKPLRNAANSVGFTVLIYLMFEKLFSVSLPPGVLGLLGLS